MALRAWSAGRRGWTTSDITPLNVQKISPAQWGRLSGADAVPAKRGQHGIMTSTAPVPVSGRQPLASLRQNFRRGTAATARPRGSPSPNALARKRGRGSVRSGSPPALARCRGLNAASSALGRAPRPISDTKKLIPACPRGQHFSDRRRGISRGDFVRPIFPSVDVTQKRRAGATTSLGPTFRGTASAFGEVGGARRVHSTTPRPSAEL